MKKSKSKKLGFTIYELLLSISLVLFMAGVSIPLTKTFLDQNELNVSLRVVLASLRKAQAFAMTGKNDSAWGIRLNSGQAIAFSGSTYAGRNANFDEISSFSTKVSNTGSNEVVFALINGETTATSIGLTSSFGTRTITINSKGIPSY